MSAEEVVKIDAFSHHLRQRICETRSKYRCGRRPTAVKVMTISDESNYLLIHNIPDIKSDIRPELTTLCQRFGPIDRLVSTDYPNREDFTQVFLVKYKRFMNAVMAKKGLDDHNFLGSVLHVCYAPELETIDETRHKLDQRRRHVFNVLTKKHSEPNRRQQIDGKEEPNVCHESIESKVEITVEKSTDFKRKYSQISGQSVESDVNCSDGPKSAKIAKQRPRIRWLHKK